jgi:hypothetical protein
MQLVKLKLLVTSTLFFCSGCSTQGVQTFVEVMKGVGEGAQQAQQTVESVDRAVIGNQPKTFTCHPQPNGVGTYCIENSSF